MARVRILVASWPGYGHLFPMVPMIRAAQAAGHEVLVSSGADMSRLIADLGVRAHRSGVTLAESYARLPVQVQISSLPPEEQLAVAARHFFGAGALDRRRDLSFLMDDWRPDLVVHDSLELGAPVAAEAAGVPHVTHGYGPMVPGTTELVHAIIGALTDAGQPDPGPAVFTAPYLDVCPPGFRGTAPNPWTTTYLLRPSAGEVAPGATLPSGLDDLPHDRTVYVTLGTVMNQAAAVFRAVLDGCSGLPVNLLVTTGPDMDPAVLGDLPPATLAAPFLPQAGVLPRCAAVVSHAGAGTMLGALCHGLPQLCLPQGTDQPFNTAALLPTGAALALEPDEITPEAVGTALSRLLDEPSFRDSAQALRREIEQMPTAAEVLDTVLARTG
jgi:UDP:flavonoid glycosyltransferase YjiC (YdhE family)